MCTCLWLPPWGKLSADGATFPHRGRLGTSRPQRCRHDRLDRVHAVLGLLEHDGLRAVKDLIGHFHDVAVKLFAHLPADGGLVVVVGGQAVHEHGGALAFAISSALT
mgnify:CR=1 FL=1